MYSETDIEAAVAAGAMTPDAAASLRNYVSSQRAAPSVDEEHFRLITGFNDIFVSIAAAILLFAVAWIGQSFGPKIGYDGPSPFAGLLAAATAWGLAEFFTRKRRMALPSIILLLAFTAGVLLTSATTLILAVGEGVFEENERAAALVAAASAAIAAAATWFHWKRFRVPITVAVGAATVVGVIMALIAYAVGDSNENVLENVLLASALALGLGVFALAMRWDSSDPRRETRRSDVAFWLHLLSAPLIVHPIFSLLGLNDGDATVGQAMVVLLVYLLLGLTALAVDRRAMLVSALAYVLFALISMFERFGAVELNIALAAFVIGSGLLLLSAFWHNVRKAVVNPLPAGVQAKLPVLDRPTTVAHAAA
jgi:MFS family permease